MSKDYLSIEQASAALGKSEDEVRSLVEEGKLREYRDAGKVFYKKAEVDQLMAGGSSVVDLQSDDVSPEEISLDDNESFASALSSLADSSASLGALDESPHGDELPEVDPAADSGTQITMAADDSDSPAALNVDEIPEELPAAPADDQPEFSSEIDLLPSDDPDGSAVDIASIPSAEGSDVPDLGLSGSSIISLEPGDSGIADTPVAKEDTKFSKVGISVFDDDEIEVETDPMGETQISSGVDEFDAVGSGSGLLDLTQESDDTSLGAELLDVISPSDAAETELEAESIEAETLTEGPVAVVEEEAPAPTVAAPRAARVAVETPGGTALNISMLFGVLGLAALGMGTAGVLQGAWPSVVMDHISEGPVHWGVFGGLALVSVVLGVVSILAGRK